jgi:Asp-tRNA(Asn)/Glu-tRNA(Gln) amidotransferase A subunit family amidase
MMVILENKLDVLVRLHTPLPPAKIGWPDEPGEITDLRNELLYGPNAGLTEVLVPAGFVDTAYDAVFELSEDRKKYLGKTSQTPTKLDGAGLPFSLVFRVEPGMEDRLMRVASAYEAASKRRVPPPQFGPLKTKS